MLIISIESIAKNGSEVQIEAVVDDVVEVSCATRMDPPEWGPALCEATFELHEDEALPSEDVNDSKLLEFIQSLDLDWQVVRD